jgi:cell division protease FtsH
MHWNGERVSANERSQQRARLRLKLPEPPSPRWRRIRRLLVFWIVALLVINYWSASRALQPHARIRIPYSPTFLEQVRRGNVIEIASKRTAVQGTFRKEVTYPAKDGRSSTRFKTEVPTFADTTQLSRLLEDKNVVINAQSPNAGAPWWETLLFGFGPTILLVGLLIYLMRRAGAGGALGMFGRSKARRYEGGEGSVTFQDVAGIEEAKRELTEVVDFLRNPDRYRKLGARIPHGVLLYGPPGTGKTLLARAVAGEAGAPFFSVSASEFIEAIVGIGASRVRDLFAQARATPPAIVFIDELDAIGRSRSAATGFGGGNDEREQTLNQILTEMDGFDAGTGVIVIGATNRPDVLDQALLRPGRFDRRVAVQAPDRPGREAILRVHTRGMPLADDVELSALAATTVGMVGADLANLANEAALVAATRDHERIGMADFTDALEKIILGAERKLRLTAIDRERTAYHEGGHALVGMLTPHADRVRKVSIIPRGMALGVTLSAPADDRVSYSRAELIARIKVALGGRAAEEIVYDELTTGAESDLQQLTQIARHMVGRFGMSDKIGPLTATPADGQGPLLPGAEAVSQRTQELVDEETRAIVEEAHDEVLQLLAENRSRLDSLAQALLANETLDEAAAYEAAGLSHDVEAPAAATLS